MRNRRLILGAALMLTAVLAYVLQDVVRTTIILPAAYISWVAGIYYRSIPQFLTWVLALMIIFFVILDSLLPGELPTNVPSIPHRSSKATLETLTGWLVKAPGGVYYKWLIANRLGKIAQELFDQGSISLKNRSLTPVNRGELSLTDPVIEYIEVGLFGSFADHPHPRLPWVKASSSPLDMDPMEVVTQLESIAGDIN